MRQWIKENPLVAIFVALIVGALFLAAPIAIVVAFVKGKASKVAGGKETTTKDGTASADARAEKVGQ